MVVMKANVKSYYLVVKVLKTESAGIASTNYLFDDINEVIAYCFEQRKREVVLSCDWTVFADTSSKIQQKLLDEKVSHDKQFLL